jgi:glyoxalase family protein
MDLYLTGMHHVSALSARIDRSHHTFSQILGMRPVIKTVNQDAPTMYHLFYGDGVGSPGSDMTLFDLPHAARERPGNHSISRTTLRVQGLEALRYWADRLDSHGIAHGPLTTRDGHAVLDFEDPEGMMLSLVDDHGLGDGHPWDDSPVPAAYQIRGLGYAMLTLPELEPTDRFLRDALGLVPDHSYMLEVDAAPSDPDGGREVPAVALAPVHVYRTPMGGPGVHTELHLVIRPDLPRARYGAGGVHHIALRVPPGQTIEDWAPRITGLGYAHSGVVPRHYFTSLYVREPGGILIELATDEPGFDVDGPLDGDRLSLPPFLESRRTQIEGALRPLAPARDMMTP